MSQPLLKEMHYARVPVTDLDAAVAWYTRCLGLQHAWTRNDMAMVRQEPGLMLVLMKADAGSQSHFTVNGSPVESLTFTSPEIRRLHEHLVDQGVQVDDLIEDDNGFLFFHFFDLCGNKFQVHW